MVEDVLVHVLPITDRISGGVVRDVRRPSIQGLSVSESGARKDRRDPSPSAVATAQERRFPDFIIPGAQKGGTSSLYTYLSQHPQAGPAARKEIHYFNRWYANGLDWYRAFFPRFDEAQFCGEASPNYLADPDTPFRIATDLPLVKIVVLLRNPVDRAYSHYWMQVRRRNERRTFEEATAIEPLHPEEAGSGPSADRSKFSYLQRGLYAEQVAPWLRAIPTNRLLVVRSETFFAEPAIVLNEVFDFLGMPRYHPTDLGIRKDGGGYPPMNSDTRARLIEWFEPHNKRLEALLSRSMDWD